jgi:hypothetical protein
VFGAAAAASTISDVSSSLGGYRRLWIVRHLVMAAGVAVPAFVPKYRSGH